MNYFTPYVHIHNQQKDLQRQQQRLRNRNDTSSPWSFELNRLLCAAVVNQQFCQLLLTEPETAMKLGFNGESFMLSAQERWLILSIQATTLESFTQQLLSLNENGSNLPRQPDPVIDSEDSLEGHETPTIHIRSLVPFLV
jgi:hypothetical protein